MWLKPSAGPAILVATRNRTKFSEARRTAGLLRHLGLEPVATLLLTRGAQGLFKGQVQQVDGRVSVEGSTHGDDRPENEASA